MATEAEIERLKTELAAAHEERTQSAAYGLELLKENEKARLEVQQLREALDKALSEQRVSATTVFEKEVQLMNDSDALEASFTIAKQEIEKELKLAKSELELLYGERDRLQLDRDELARKIEMIDQDRKLLRIDIKDQKSREDRLLHENSELEEENVSLQKQLSTLRSTQVEFESSKHEIERLQYELGVLTSQLEEMVTLRRITERQMEEALEALKSEREQKYALKRELDKCTTNDPNSINWTSLMSELSANGSQTSGGKDASVQQQASGESSSDLEKKAEAAEAEDVQSLKKIITKKNEQLRQLRTVINSNQKSAEVALKNLKSCYEMEKAIVAETMTKLRHEHKRLNEDAATFASLRSQFRAREEDYKSEIEKLERKLRASEDEKGSLNSVLRMAIEQKVLLNQKNEALELKLEEYETANGGGRSNNNNKNVNQSRLGGLPARGRGGGGGQGANRNSRGGYLGSPRTPGKQSGNNDQSWPDSCSIPWEWEQRP